jgi:hypothetical protein
MSARGNGNAPGSPPTDPGGAPRPAEGFGGWRDAGGAVGLPVPRRSKLSRNRALSLLGDCEAGDSRGNRRSIRRRRARRLWTGPRWPAVDPSCGCRVAPAETSRGPRGLRRVSFRTWDVSTAFAGRNSWCVRSWGSSFGRLASSGRWLASIVRCRPGSGRWRRAVGRSPRWDVGCRRESRQCRRVDSRLRREGFRCRRAAGRCRPEEGGRGLLDAGGRRIVEGRCRQKRRPVGGSFQLRPIGALFDN